FFREDGKGRIVDDFGKEATAFRLLTPYHLETLTNIRCYCESQGPEQESLIEDLDTRMKDVVNLVGTVKKQ
ncbi:hypothetical protein K501DRAFT_199917, partial [Backusella circina FSU 941]